MALISNIYDKNKTANIIISNEINRKVSEKKSLDLIRIKETVKTENTNNNEEIKVVIERKRQVTLEIDSFIKK
jgi:hypothetical protein